MCSWQSSEPLRTVTTTPSWTTSAQCSCSTLAPSELTSRIPTSCLPLPVSSAAASLSPPPSYSPFGSGCKRLCPGTVRSVSLVLCFERFQGRGGGRGRRWMDRLNLCELWGRWDELHAWCKKKKNNKQTLYAATKRFRLFRAVLCSERLYGVYGCISVIRHAWNPKTTQTEYSFPYPVVLCSVFLFRSSIPASPSFSGNWLKTPPPPLFFSLSLLFPLN